MAILGVFPLSITCASGGHLDLGSSSCRLAPGTAWSRRAKGGEHFGPSQKCSFKRTRRDLRSAYAKIMMILLDSPAESDFP